MKNIRIWFKKLDTARYISHLDLSRCMERAIHKAKLPFWYTEGFNPHVFLTITMPLSLGFSGTRESMDVKLLEDDFPFSEIIEKLNSGLPKDIEVYEVTEAKMKPGAVAFSKYEIEISEPDASVIADNIEKMFEDEKVMVWKKTKKGEGEIDIKPDFAKMKTTVKKDDFVRYSVILKSSNNGSINPNLLFDAYNNKYGKQIYARINRVYCYDEKMNLFI